MITQNEGDLASWGLINMTEEDLKELESLIRRRRKELKQMENTQ